MYKKETTKWWVDGESYSTILKLIVTPRSNFILVSKYVSNTGISFAFCIPNLWHKIWTNKSCLWLFTFKQKQWELPCNHSIVPNRPCVLGVSRQTSSSTLCSVSGCWKTKLTAILGYSNNEGPSVYEMLPSIVFITVTDDTTGLL